MTMTPSAVERVARAIVSELARQDGDDWEMPEGGKLAYLDQGEVDFYEVARAAISAMPGGGWQDIATAPLRERVLFGYYGPDVRHYGTIAMGHLFKWEGMDKALATGLSVDPTHWMPLPSPPASEEPSQ